MGKMRIQCLFLALAIVVTFLLLHSHQAAAAAAELSDDEELAKEVVCNGDLKKLLSSCKKCIKKGTDQVDPKPACCRTVKKIDLLCICQSIPPRFEKKIDMEKVVYIAEKCEKPIPSGTKCGSKPS
ncbi:hypothetical protein ACMD2_01592 [Ananas comosus]|uniref:Bifunctional inhibitor/plant lipid transfer protein/seed storage helical domain-containing protein n=1 Tax=Ananas comosus TaxID=4615 RepID=A0A199VXU0_ANACO|nr:hypothetical protein ACMD2_01592 [Ananas comosus]